MSSAPHGPPKNGSVKPFAACSGRATPPFAYTFVCKGTPMNVLGAALVLDDVYGHVTVGVVRRSAQRFGSAGCRSGPYFSVVFWFSSESRSARTSRTLADPIRPATCSIVGANPFSGAASRGHC